MDLRRKRDEEAQRALAAAQHAARQAQAEVVRQETLLAETLARAGREEAHASDLAQAVWARQWMRRQRQVIEQARRDRDERQRAERVAAAQAMEARRRLRALERLRERMWQAFVTNERRAEQKELDVLGGLRYVARRDVPGGA